MNNVKINRIANNPVLNHTVNRKEEGAMRNTKNTRKIKNAVLVTAAAVSALVIAPRHSLAVGSPGLFTLSNGNSSVSINPNADPSEADGLYNWSVDGISQVGAG